MGLDIYAGSLTRYHLGAWETIVQQAAAEQGFETQIVRVQPEPEDLITNPDAVLEMVIAWREKLASQLGVDFAWPEGPDIPYRTDKPGWEGWGAMQLLAAYAEHPNLMPRDRPFRKAKPDDPGRYFDAAAYQATVADPSKAKFPALMLNTEWWLPVDLGRSVLAAQGPHGAMLNLAGVDELLSELQLLNETTLGLDADELASARQSGPGDPSSFASMAPFGLAVLLELARFGSEHRTPVLLDY